MNNSNLPAEFKQAMICGYKVRALVLRGESIRFVKGREVKPGELLTWTTIDRNDHWHRVAEVVTRRVGTYNQFFLVKDGEVAKDATATSFRICFA